MLMVHTEKGESGREDARASAYTKNMIKGVSHSEFVLLRFMKHLLLFPRL